MQTNFTLRRIKLGKSVENNIKKTIITRSREFLWSSFVYLTLGGPNHPILKYSIHLQELLLEIYIIWTGKGHRLFLLQGQYALQKGVKGLSGAWSLAETLTHWTLNGTIWWLPVMNQRLLYMHIFLGQHSIQATRFAKVLRGNISDFVFTRMSIYAISNKSVAAITTLCKR